MKMTIETNPLAFEAEPQVAADWVCWLSNKEEISKSVYCTNPNLLIADINRERECSQDYEGREVLELLQNASDAAAELGEPSRVQINLLRERLVVANSGAPFTREGGWHRFKPAILAQSAGTDAP